MSDSVQPAASIPDAEARRRAVQSAGCVLVQAPAGSGKTTLLTQRYLRLVGRTESPERILALTFTRRAAQEMRERILNALAAGSQPARPAGLDEETWMLAVQARRHLEARNIDLGQHPARVRIETIDAFNAWLAAQLPVTAGAGAVREVREDPRPLYRQAARRALAHTDEPDSAVERVLALDDQRWRQLTDLIAQMLPSRDRWLPLLVGRLNAPSGLDDRQVSEVRRLFDEDLAILIARVLREAEEVIGAERLESVVPLLHAAARYGAPGLAPFLSDARPLEGRIEDLARWRALQRLVCTADAKKLRQVVNASHGFPPKSAAKAAMQDWLAELAREPGAVGALKRVRDLPDATYSDQAWERVRDIAEVLVLAAASLERVFAEQGACDFCAVSLAALRALGASDAPTDLALRLDYSLEHILVDEFQDTSSAQLRLLELLTAGWQRGDGRSVFCVGDPMQSIYGFRQAEVRAFLELAETGIGSLRFELERLESNFRAQASLIEWVNATFARILPARDDRARGAIAFRPSRPAGAGSRMMGTEARGAGAAGDEPPVLLRSFSSPRAEARAIAASIKARAQRHPHWRIAVLVRARAHAQPVAQALRESGIAFEAVDVEPLIERPAVRDVLTLLRALLHPADRIAWLGLLRSPWVGLRLADLLIVSSARGLIVEALGDELILARLSEEGRGRCSRARTILESAFEGRARHGLARWLEATWLALGGAAGTSSELDLEHVRVFLERVALLEQRGVPDSADLEESFAELSVPSSLESSRPQGGAEGTTATGRIEIMTIHKAKGLEFDCVFVPALERPTRSGSSELLLTHEFARTGRDGLVMAARPPVAADDRGLFDFLRTQVREAAALESQRLLYVACTRAKCELHLTATIESLNGTDDAETDGGDEESVPASPRQPFRPWPGSLLDILWPVAREAFELARTDPLSVASAEERGREGSAPTLSLLRLPLEWRAPGPAEPGIAPPASMLEREDAPPFDWVGETARRVGTLVHAELERLQPGLVAPERMDARATGYRRWLMLRGVPEEHLDAAAARVVEALLAVQSDERGRWILTPRVGEDYREHALSGLVGGETQRAVFDRCFVEDGVRWVIDYKTSEHRGGGLEAFLDREVERYRPQLQRYAELARRLGPEPVRVALYFPLMRAWREWNPATPWQNPPHER